MTDIVPTPGERLLEFVSAIAADLGDRALEINEAADGVTFEDAIEARAQLEDVKITLGYVIAEVDRQIISKISREDRFRGVPLPGGGTLKVSGDKEVERYDQPGITSQYARAFSRTIAEAGYRVITPDGEEADVEDVIEPVVRTMTEATGAAAPSFSSWRSGVAKKYGVNLKAGATTVVTDPKVRIEGRSRGGV